MHMRFIVVGLPDSPCFELPVEVLQAISTAKVFSGGKRHHELVRHWLPQDASWIDIVAPMKAVFDEYESTCRVVQADELVVFVSNDPLFYGFANTIKRFMPDTDIRLYPYFNSLQMLAHRLVMPYHDMRIVSLTGRPWHEFDCALIERCLKIGVLTDREHTPAAIAARMLAYGFDGYTMSVGEHLGHPEKERVRSLAVQDAVVNEFEYPNCLILHAEEGAVPQREYGIEERRFALLDGRVNMITKMPIRLLSLQALHLRTHRVFWDIGFCTGSISIEAKLQFPYLHVVAFEIRPDCETILQENQKRFHCPGIMPVMGDFLEADLTGLPSPDAVFIGGHGGRLKEILHRIVPLLSAGAHVVMNSVTPQSLALFDEAVAELGLHAMRPMYITVDNHNPIHILSATK
uniref:Bifunctional cobalt-precorrin-7 (C(5))-methyltransferase/cobalt-precorrin-6B (C(15))-methyltransferase n=1 Tax=Prevotella sp. GTC17260 TaxID=3236796 RepID=A0AB33J895_9BACT